LSLRKTIEIKEKKEEGGKKTKKGKDLAPVRERS
jgi:hypothetical protein